MSVRSACAVAFAFANLYLLFLTGPFVSPQHQLIFHLPGPATPLFAAAALDLLAAFGLIFLALLLARKRPRARLLVWAALLFPLPFALTQTISTFAGEPASSALLWSTGFFAVAAFVLTVIRARRLLPLFERIRPRLTLAFALVSLSGVVLFAQLLWSGWQARSLNPPFVPRASSDPSPSSLGAPAPAFPPAPRILWIILDELSFRQVYGDRLPGLALPHFDQLAAESSVFTRVSATAQFTRVAVPALLTGVPLTETAASANGHTLLLRPEGRRSWRAFNPQDTVFGDVAHAGLPTGLAGWYEPYCRILPGVLDRCFWTYTDNLPGGFSADAPISRNAFQPLRLAAGSALHLVGIGSGPPAEDALDPQRHFDDYEALLAAADVLLRSQPGGLIYLHMPVPHPWGFFDRRTGTFPGHRTTYLDNLALADAYIGHVRSLLQGSGEWDHTTVILMGDHGWRSQAIWSHSDFWTPEEQAASRAAAFPDPPAMLVKLAGQHTSARIDAPFDAVRTRALVDALLRRGITTPGDLNTWVKNPPPSRAAH